MAKTTKADKETLVKLDNYFSAALDHPTWKNWRTNSEKCHKYKEGEQWTSKETAELDDRGQPVTVNNQIKITIDRMVGQFVKQRTRIGYRGRNPQDEPIANTLSDLLLFIKQQNNLEFEERDMAEDGFTGGFGVLEVYTTFNDLLQPEIKIRAEDCFNVFPDPHSKRYDWNEDANFICRAKWLDLDEAKELYPDNAKELSQLSSPDYAGGPLSGIESFKKENYYDEKLKRIRIVEVWYKQKTRESKFFLSNGQTVDAELDPEDIKGYESQGIKVKRIDRIKVRMKVGVFTGGILLEYKDSPYDHNLFPFIPYSVNRKKSGEPYSQIYTALSLQDAINKRESKALHLLNTNQCIFEEGAITDEAQLATEMARPDGLVKINQGYFEKFVINKNIDVAATQFNLHNEAKADFRRVTGINPDAMGEKSEVRSGIGIARKQAMTDLIIAPVFDNFRRTRTLMAKVILELIKQYYTEEMVFYITDDVGASRTIQLNANTDFKARLKEGIYDVVIEEMPDITTMQQEQFEMLAQMLPSILPYGPAWVKTLIELSDLRNKHDVVKKIEGMSGPPPAEPKINVSLSWEELDPIEKAAFAQKMGMQELMHHEAKNGQPPKSQSEGRQEQIKTASEMTKMKMDVMKSEMDMEHKRESHAMDMQKKAMDSQRRDNGGKRDTGSA